MPTIREEFGTFITQNNLIGMAIAFVVGLAIVAVMTALVADIFTPVIGIFLHVNFSSWTYTVNGSTIMQGAFVNALITFLITMLVVFFVIALPYQKHKEAVAKRAAAAPPTTRACPECTSQIPFAATRCSFCTAVVPAVQPPAAAAAPAKKKWI